MLWLLTLGTSTKTSLMALGLTIRMACFASSAKMTTSETTISSSGATKKVVKEFKTMLKRNPQRLQAFKRILVSHNSSWKIIKKKKKRIP